MDKRVVVKVLQRVLLDTYMQGYVCGWRDFESTSADVAEDTYKKIVRALARSKKREQTKRGGGDGQN